MRPATQLNSDYMSHSSGFTYNSSSLRSSSLASRNFGYSSSSPKNEQPKAFSYTTKLKNDYSGKYTPKAEKVSESAYDRKTPRGRDTSGSRVQTFSSTHSGFYDSEKNQEEKKTFIDLYKNSQVFSQNSSVRNSNTTSPLSRSLYLKDANREETNILSRKKYDIDLDSGNTRMPAETKSYSTKNSDKRDRNNDSSSKNDDYSLNKGGVAYYPLDEFISKYSANRSPTGTQNSKYQTEKSESYTQPLTMSRSMANSTSKQNYNLRSSLYSDSNNTKSSSSIKTNNFVDRRESLESTSKAQRGANSAQQYEHKKYEPRNYDDDSSNYDKPLLSRSDSSQRRSSHKNYESSVDHKGAGHRAAADSREKYTTYSSQTPQGSNAKVSLDSFITKVDRGGVSQTFKRFEENNASNGRDGKGDLCILSNNEEKSASIAPRESPFKVSQALLNKEPKFFRAIEKAAKDSDLSYSNEFARWNGKSTRPSTARNDDSTDGSQDEDYQCKSKFVYHMTHLEKHLRNYDERDYFSQIYREHFQQSFQSMKLCRFMSPPDARAIANKKVYLPKKDIYKNKKTIVFDMDETLIHCTDSPVKRCDVKLPIRFPQGEVIEAGINVRPYAIECLKELSQHFEIIVFTASHKCYANVVLDYLDPKKQYIQHRLFRDSCIYTDEGVYVKDLRVIGNRNLQDLILVDNAAYSFAFQIDNGVPIIPFYENKSDQELKHLTPFLKKLASSTKDVREVLKKTFKLHLYPHYQSKDEVMDNVIFQD